MSKKESQKKDAENHKLVSFRWRITFPESTKEARESEKILKIDDEEIGTFYLIGKDFTTRLQMIWKYLNSIGGIAQATTSTNIYSLHIFIGELVESQKLRKKNEKHLAVAEFESLFEDIKNKKRVTKKFDCKIYDSAHLKRLVEYRNFQDVALGILHETAIQQIVNSYEQLLGDILSWQLNSNPDAALDDRTITYKDLLSFSSFEEAKKHVIDSEINSFMKNMETEEQIKYFENEFKIDILSQFPDFSELKEVILRRHAIVHAGGIATAEYIRRLKKLRGFDSSQIKIGDRLNLTPEYVLRSWEIIYSFGVILIHLLAIKNARSNNNKEEQKQADGLLIGSAYACIQEEQYSTAEIILRYASKKTLSEQPANWVVNINLAQTLLWQGKSEECDEILDGYPWESTSLRYQISVLALKNDKDEFKKLLPMAISRKEILINELLEWPVFRLIRESQDFYNLVEDAGGKQISQISNVFSPKLLDFQYETTLEEINEHYKKVKKEIEGSK